MPNPLTTQDNTFDYPFNAGVQYNTPANNYVESSQYGTEIENITNVNSITV